MPASGAGAPASGTAAPEPEAKEYHFQVAGQTSADFAATQILQPDEVQILPLTWHMTGSAASQNGRRLQAEVILKETPAPVMAPVPQTTAPAAPAVHP